MIRVVYSNRTEALVAALIAELPPPGDPFDVPWVVTPSRALEGHLAIEVAARRGVTGYLSLSMRAALTKLYAEPDPQVVVVGPGHVAAELFALLSDPEVLEEPALRPLRGYLFAAGQDQDAVDRRRLQIATALASLFEQYQLWRPEIPRAFEAAADRAVPDSAAGNAAASSIQDRRGMSGTSALQAAQGQLWRLLFGEGGRLAARGARAGDGKRYLTLETLLEERAALLSGAMPGRAGDGDGDGDGDDAGFTAPAKDDVLPPALHLFAVPSFARPVQRALSALSLIRPVFVYALNPCREFWEDVGPRAEPALARRRRSVRDGGPSGSPAGLAAAAPASFEQLDLSTPDDPFRLAEAADPLRDGPLLRLWGRPGRETIRLLNHLCDCNFAARFVEPPRAGGLLAEIQRDLLARTPAPRVLDDAALSHDESVAILAAPDRRRELESIAAEIWRLVREDPEARLRFTDFAVLVPSAEPNDAGPSYLTLASAVFDEARGLPHVVADAPMGATSPYLAAVETLLAFPLGSFTRREVLALLSDPHVRVRVPDADPALWVEICDRLAIARGADRAAFDGTYVDEDVFNWDQGLRRLALGVFATGPHSGEFRPLRIGAAHYAPAELAVDRQEEAIAFAALVRSLLDDARFLRDGRHTMADWAALLRITIDTYVRPLSREDQLARLRVGDALADLADQGPAELPLSFAVASARVRERLRLLDTRRGQLFGGGVVIGTLASLRAIPFRVVFVAGLDGDKFPVTDRPAPLDLRGGRRRAGEVSARERDRYLFLEALLSARERLYLSYVARSPLTGDVRPPSSVIDELLDAFAGPSARPFIERHVRREVPRERDDDPTARAAFPAAALESRARTLGEELRQSSPAVERLAPDSTLGALRPEARALLEPILGTVSVGAPAADVDPGRAQAARILTLTDLRRFLECPLQGSARVVLELRDVADDTEGREIEHEPCTIPRPVERAVISEAFAAAWMGPEPPDERRLASAREEIIARYRAAGRLPAGPFARAIERRHRELLATWTTALRETDGGAAGPVRRLRVGRGEGPGSATPGLSAAEEVVPPLRLTVDAGRPLPVEIHATTDWELEIDGERGAVVLATSTQKFFDHRDGLRIFLAHVLRAAVAPDAEAMRAAHGAICRPDSAVQRRQFEPIAPADARRYLTMLAGDLLSRVHDYLLPVEAIFWARDRGVPIGEAIEQMRHDPYYRDRLGSNLGPVPDPFEYAGPSANEAEALADRRFGLYWALLRRPAQAPLPRRRNRA